METPQSVNEVTENPKVDQSIATWLLVIGKAIVWPLMKLIGPIVGIGRIFLPENGGLLLLSNHRSDCDVIIVQYCCPRPIRFMAKSEIFEMKIVGNLARFFRAFPIHRDSADRSALKKAIDLLKDGQVVGIFPEGETSETGEMLPLKPGISLIAKASGVPVVCVGIKNSAYIIPYGKLLPRPALRTVRVRFGQPFLYESFPNSQEFLDHVKLEIERLAR